jgi:hypothetical protein
MPRKRSDVDVWLERETPRIRRALESASRHFDINDKLTVNTLEETRAYVEMVPLYEAEFSKKSPAKKTLKEKGVRKGRYLCTEGHWVTIDDRPVFICD